MPGVREEDIRLRAYDIWVAEGRPHCRDHDHWLMAIAQLELHAAPAKTNPAQTVKTDVVAAADRAVKKPAKAKTAAASAGGSQLRQTSTARIASPISTGLALLGLKPAAP